MFPLLLRGLQLLKPPTRAGEDDPLHRAAGHYRLPPMPRPRRIRFELSKEKYKRILVTAPPFATFTEQTITAAPGPGGRRQPKPLIKEITHNIDSKLGKEST